MLGRQKTKICKQNVPNDQIKRTCDWPSGVWKSDTGTALYWRTKDGRSRILPPLPEDKDK